MVTRSLTHIEAVGELVDLAGLSVLDVGAGDGSFLRQLAQKGATATGVEISEERVIKAAKQSGCDVHLAGAQDLPFKDARFELVTFMFSLHHVPEALHEAALREAARVLRPGGDLIVAEPEIDSDMTKIVASVDDETAVRRAALASLAKLSGEIGYQLVQKLGYRLTRRYDDFEALVARVVSVDPARAAVFPSVEEEMRARFNQLAEKRGAQFEVHQKVRLMQFRLRADR